MSFNPKYLSLVKLSDSQKPIAEQLIANDMHVAPVAASLHVGKRKVTVVRTKMIEEAAVALWKQGNTPVVIQNKIGIDRHRIVKVLAPLGYSYEKVQAQSMGKVVVKRERGRYQAMVDTIKQLPAPNLTELDAFTNQYRGKLSYKRGRECVYDVFPAVRKMAHHTVLPLPNERMSELERKPAVRRAYIEGMALDFPENNNAQNWALQQGNVEKAHRLRNLTSQEQQQIQSLLTQGHTVNEIAKRFKISYKKAEKQAKKLSMMPS